MRNLMLVLLISSSTVWANSTYSQTAQMNLSVKNGTVESIFDCIRQQSGYEFFYNNDRLDVKRQISLSRNNGTLDEILGEVLGQRYTWQIKDRYVLITEKNTLPQMLPVDPVAIKGIVLDKTGLPLPGVSVMIKGTTIGVATSVDGEFALNTVKVNDITLVFSFIGMKTKEVKYAGQSMLKIILEDNVSEMEEVVVTGYQTVKKPRMTGAVEVVTAAEIANKGFVTVEEALKGQLAGVSTLNVTGRPGGQAQIRVRGINSLTGNTDPIWIVDGMPLQGDLPDVGVAGSDLQNTVLTNGLGNLSPDEIESITILKDAAATAIYGSRAANGVIVVTTKRGKSGPGFINIQSSYSIDEAPTSKLQMMNTTEKIAFETALYNDFPQVQVQGRIFTLLRDADAGRKSREHVASEIERLGKINTNWHDEIFRVAQSHNHMINMAGGTEKTQYYASLNYLGQQGVMPNNKYEKFGGSIKLTHDFNNKLKVYFDVYTNLRNDRSSASVVDPLRYATYANPYERPYREDGSYDYDRSYYPDLSMVKDGYKYDFNVLEDLNANTSKTRYISNQINLKLEYKILESLKFATSGTFSNTSSHTNKALLPSTFSSKYSSWIRSIYKEKEITDNLNNGSLEENTARSQSYTWRNQLEYNQTFKQIHYVSAILGHEMSENKSNLFGYYSPEYDPLYGLVGFPDLTDIIATRLNMTKLFQTKESQNRSVSFFATASYSYMDKYVISGSYRMDGVDIIGTDNRFTPLWNASFKYNLHREDFMENVSFLNMLSIRGSYGFTGSIDRNAYPFTLLQYGSSSYRYNGEKIPSVITPGNPSVKWQRKEDRSIGLDFALLGNRISGTVNYYNNDTRDLLDRKKLPLSTGKDEVKANVASLKNRGWEFSLNTVNIDYKDFRWTTSFNISVNKNRVTSTYYNSVRELPEIARGVNSQSYFVEGQPVNAWYGYQFAGVDPATGNSLAYIDANGKNGKPLGHLTADGRYVINMDTEFTNDALQFLGEGYPPVSGGFGTVFTWKRFTLSSQFSFMAGHKIKSFKINNGNPMVSAQYNQLSEEQYRWRKPGDITNIPAYTVSANASTKYFFSSEVENGAFLKCNNVSLGYNMPSEWCSKLRLTQARLNFNVQNLFVSTKYRGLDPENMGAFGYPSARKFIISLNIGI